MQVQALFQNLNAETAQDTRTGSLFYSRHKHAHGGNEQIL